MNTTKTFLKTLTNKYHSKTTIFKARKKEMDNTLADGDVEGIDSMFEYLADRARAGKTGRKG